MDNEDALAYKIHLRGFSDSDSDDFDNDIVKQYMLKKAPIHDDANMCVKIPKQKESKESVQIAHSQATQSLTSNDISLHLPELRWNKRKVRSRGGQKAKGLFNKQLSTYEVSKPKLEKVKSTSGVSKKEHESGSNSRNLTNRNSQGNIQEPSSSRSLHFVPSKKKIPSLMSVSVKTPNQIKQQQKQNCSLPEVSKHQDHHKKNNRTLLHEYQEQKTITPGNVATSSKSGRSGKKLAAATSWKQFIPEQGTKETTASNKNKSKKQSSMCMAASSVDLNTRRRKGQKLDGASTTTSAQEAHAVKKQKFNQQMATSSEPNLSSVKNKIGLKLEQSSEVVTTLNHQKRNLKPKKVFMEHNASVIKHVTTNCKIESNQIVKQQKFNNVEDATNEASSILLFSVLQQQSFEECLFLLANKNTKVSLDNCKQPETARYRYSKDFLLNINENLNNNFTLDPNAKIPQGISKGSTFEPKKKSKKKSVHDVSTQTDKETAVDKETQIDIISLSDEEKLYHNEDRSASKIIAKAVPGVDKNLEYIKFLDESLSDKLIFLAYIYLLLIVVMKSLIPFLIVLFEISLLILLLVCVYLVLIELYVHCRNF